MRVQKSVYLMSDRELRAYKRKKRRQRILRNRICVLVFSICILALITVFYSSIQSSANTGEDKVKLKYYTQIIINQGESLWSIADEYIDDTQYHDKAEYIAEVTSINHLNENGDIRCGQTLVVPYYSAEFFK